MKSFLCFLSFENRSLSYLVGVDYYYVFMSSMLRKYTAVFFKPFFVFDLNIPVVFCEFTEKTIQFAHNKINNVPCALWCWNRRTDRVLVIFLYDELMTNGIRCLVLFCSEWGHMSRMIKSLRPFSLIKQNNEKFSKLVHVNWHNVWVAFGSVDSFVFGWFGLWCSISFYI